MSAQIWKIMDQSLVWEVKPGQVHCDRIEFSGLHCDMIVQYGVREDGGLLLARQAYFPMLRTIPNDTHGTFCFDAKEVAPLLVKNAVQIVEYPRVIRIDGTLTVESDTKEGFSVMRRLFPSVDRRFAVERIRVCATEAVKLSVSLPNTFVHSYGRGTKGVYVATIAHTAPETFSLEIGDCIEFDVFYTARIANEKLLLPNGAEEELKRRARISALCDEALVLETGCEEIDVMTRFAKLRAGESIFETLTGNYHSPGGGPFYGAVIITC